MYETSWEPIAHTLGFNSEVLMLQHLYIEQGLSIRELSTIIGYSTCAVSRRLAIYRIPKRRRGGNQRQGKRTLANLSDSQVFDTPPGRLAEALKVNVSTVFAEKRFRLKERKSNEV
jgi:hypothetical protein